MGTQKKQAPGAFSKMIETEVCIVRNVIDRISLLKSLTKTVESMAQIQLSKWLPISKQQEKMATFRLKEYQINGIFKSLSI